MTKIERPDLKPLYDDWVKRITEYLLPLNPSYIPRLNMVIIERGGGFGPDWDIWNFVNAKSKVLIEILKEREQFRGGI